jgi:hypothetical protein
LRQNCRLALAGGVRTLRYIQTNTSLSTPRRPASLLLARKLNRRYTYNSNFRQ